MRVHIPGAKRDRVGRRARQVIAGSAADRDGVDPRRQMGKEIKTIHRGRSRYCTTGIRQGDDHTIDWLLLIRLLDAVTVSIQVDEIAN